MPALWSALPFWTAVIRHATKPCRWFFRLVKTGPDPRNTSVYAKTLRIAASGRQSRQHNLQPVGKHPHSDRRQNESHDTGHDTHTRCTQSRCYGLRKREHNTYKHGSCLTRETVSSPEEDPSNQLLGSSITYRIAVGPQQGRKVMTLQTLADCGDDAFTTKVGNVAGFSLHAGVATRANERAKLERWCRNEG